MTTSDRNPVLSQIDTDPGYRRVAKAIEEAILAGRLKVGDLLPTELDLAGQLGVHRSTVREGIRALENAGLVRRAEAKRLVVCVPPVAKLARDNSRALSLMHVSFLDLWEIQLQLEPFAALAAARRAPPELLTAIRANVEALRRDLEDDEAVIASDLDFHHLIALAAGNKALDLCGAPMRDMLFSATQDLYATVPQARHRLLEAHDAIAQAIETGDADAAQVWMTRHIEDFRRGYEVAGFDLTAPMPIRPSH